ncbi:AraC family transcriptional regulator [Neptuniibacter halophilus]|uniref:AraC family transcriptional regulator n=1 Tax=Neptuniibacter halophilus TaxID=651666 RepID=UPI0025737BC3|nr:AraC family transcriptional regulator [Neptuniibacter halophilus]
MDKLSQILQSLEVNADVFFSGTLCGINAFDDHQDSSVLHFLESGSLTLSTGSGHCIELGAGSVIFFPSGCNHEVKIAPAAEARLVCATVKIPLLHKQVLSDNLPLFLCFDIQHEEAITHTAKLIFSEAFAEQSGRQLMINRLCDIFVLQMLRSVISNGTVELGLIAAGSHPSLAPLIQAIKDNPEQEWSVDEMANAVAMSRSKFAALFKETLGQSPIEYVTHLRMVMAKGLLKQQRPVGLVANDVGYENASSLAKVFKKHFGVTPKQWIKAYFNSDNRAG